MALLTQYCSFFISPFGEKSAADELNAFLRSRRIINVEKRLIDGEHGAGWVFLVEYACDGKNAPPSAAAGTPAPRIDYREVLNSAEYALFDKLRALRKDLAEKAGIPVYAVFTNEQLAALVKKPPRTAKDLLAIAGIGESRARQYGPAFLKLFAEHGASSGAGSGDSNSHGEPEQEQTQDETGQRPF
ncbi:MAG: HRDC domain-containing protein [Treponema sp.]|jgi:superfamily II DNA helicase RecQ|nr:HRDC domain-containing protein [Treponema sp.]